MAATAGAGGIPDASSFEGEWKSVLSVHAKPSLRIVVTDGNWTIEEGVPLDNAPTVTRFKLDEAIETYGKLYHRRIEEDKLHTKTIFRLSDDTLTEVREKYNWLGTGGPYRYPSIQKTTREFQIKDGRLVVEVRGRGDHRESAYERCSSTRGKRQRHQPTAADDGPSRGTQPAAPLDDNLKRPATVNECAAQPKRQRRQPPATDDGPSRRTQPAEPLDDSLKRPDSPAAQVQPVSVATPHPPPSAGKSLCQLAEEFLIVSTSVDARYRAIIEYVLRLRCKRSTEEREKLKDRLEMVLVDGVPASHFGKNPDCNVDTLEAYVVVCNGGFTTIQQDLPGLMSVFEGHALQAQDIRANEVFTATVVENVREFCRKLKAVDFPIVEDLLEAMLRCLFRHVYGPKDFAKVWLAVAAMEIRREFAELCVAIA